MELKHYLSILWRRKLVIGFTLVITAAITVLGTLRMTPVYQASSKLHIATPSRGAVDWVEYDTLYADRFMNTLADIVMDDSLRATVAMQIGAEKDSLDISAEILPNTELMKITVAHENPILAAKAVNAVVETLIAQSNRLADKAKQSTRESVTAQLAQLAQELEQDQAEHKTLSAQLPDTAGRLANLNQTIQLKRDTYATLAKQYEQIRLRETLQTTTFSIIEPASVPTEPVKPNRSLNLGLGLLVGLLGGLGLAILLENLDTTFYTKEQIQAESNVALLGEIPIVKKQRQITFANSNSFQGEAFHRLRSNLTTYARTTPLQTLLITSAQPNEGKSTIAVNLAITLAQAGRKIVLIDCDLRRPVLHEIFKLPNEIGLTNLLTRYSSLAEVLQPSKVAGIQVITSGPLSPYPAELLASPQMASLIEQLSHTFDMVLFDTPALLAVADATAVATLVDGVVLVVSRGQTHTEAAHAARVQLTNVNANLVGVILNRARLDTSAYQYYQQKIKQA